MNSNIFKFYCHQKTSFLLGMFLCFFIQILNARAEDSIQDQFNSITPEQREMYNIKVAEWKPATATLPARAFLVGCHDCAGANYDLNGNLTDKNGNLISATKPWSSKKIPTSWIMMVPEIWNGRGVVIIHPTDHVQALTLFSAAIGALMNEGFTIATMKHPLPGEPGFPLDALLEPPFHVHDLRNSYLGTGTLLRGLMSEVFGAPVGFYAFSLSLGTFAGLGLLAAEVDAPFDGYAMGIGGNGRLTQLMTFKEAFQTEPNRLPLTGMPLLQTNDAEKVARVAEILAIIDPEYVADINGAPVNEQLPLALAYNVAERPNEVQKAWADMELGAELKKPTIVFQGLRDRRVPPVEAIAYAERIVDAGFSDLFRLYLVKDMAHGPADPPVVPQILSADAVRKLDAWVQTGNPPDETDCQAHPQACLAGAQHGPQRNCTAFGFGQDPLECFCNVLDGGVGGFCSLDSNTVCMTDNPTTPANEDICVTAGKGLCDAVIPDECGS